MTKDRWCVIRTDDNGTATVMARNLTQEEATILEQRMTNLGHKQLYEAKPQEQEKDAT